MYKIIDRYSKIIFYGSHRKTYCKFDTRYELLKFIKYNFYYTKDYDWNGFRKDIDNLVENNGILTKCCHNWNEFRYNIIHDYEIIKEKEYFEYMIIDPYDRIMNIPDLAEEAHNLHIKKEKRKKYIYKPRVHPENCKWVLWKRRGAPPGYGYYREKTTQKERRIACDPMHKPYVRSKRNINYLNPYNIESKHCIQGTWKNLKIKKQYMEKIIKKSA